MFDPEETSYSLIMESRSSKNSIWGLENIGVYMFEIK